MSLEIEAKFKVDSHDPVRKQLIARGAQIIGKCKELNQLFDRQDMRLRRTGCGLRIRSLEVIEGKPQQATLTFKGPRRSGTLKVRPEHETHISNPQTTAKILDGLGFSVFIAFEKLRETWRFREGYVELDEIPHLGKFIEIEGTDEASIRKIQAQLGLEQQTQVGQTYVGMLANYCKATGLDPTTIRF